jgi:hypothetical protein
MLTVGELIARLEDYDEDAEVRLMTQQSWPFENSVHGIVDANEMGNEDGDEEPDPHDYQDNGPAPVYIVEGRQLGYGNKNAWNGS